MLRQIAKTQFISQLKNLQGKEGVSSPFMVKFAQLGTDKNSKPFLNLVLVDSTGEIEARIWSDAPKYAGQVVRDALVNVQGRLQSYQGRLQVVISELEILREDQVTLADYLPQLKLDPDALHAELLKFVDSMSDPHYQALARAVLRDDAEIVGLFKRAPAAKAMHHAYPGGLLEHVLSITRILDFMARHYGDAVSRDLLFLGGFFHDIAKVWELGFERTTDYTTEGKLVGHLVMGAELVERKVRELDEAFASGRGQTPGLFPQQKKLLVKHLILAHHGKLEYGSPVLPQTLEALIVHYVDDLDSKVNQIGGFIAQDQAPGDWTALNKHHNRFFYKGSV